MGIDILFRIHLVNAENLCSGGYMVWNGISL